VPATSCVARLRLRDGRQLSYIERGAPDGFPVFHFHGAASCMLEAPGGTDASASARAGVRLIAFDRPGYGGSARRGGRRVVDCASDVEQLADALGIARFAVSGWSMGGPHALACAVALPDRVCAVAVMSGAAPRQAPGGVRALAPFETVMMPLSRWMPPVAAGALLLSRRSARRHPDRWLKSLTTSAITAAPDRALLTGVLAPAAVDNYNAAVAHGVFGIVDDYRAVMRDWGFALDQVESEVLWLHGELDATIPLAHARWTTQHLPHAELLVAAGAGHLLPGESVEVLWRALVDASHNERPH
jgi:pimeloyl-ACP methyl ester carboxylesterase